MTDAVNVGLIGLGVIGSGVAKILREKAGDITRQIGTPLVLKRVVDSFEARRNSPVIDPLTFSTDVQDILNDPEIDIVIELIGGENPAHDFIRKALSNGKHVVTANKEVMAKHGLELLALANEHRVGLYYEASVGGGIPLISPLKRNLQVNDISAIHSIINGTTNFILTRMQKEGLEFSSALREAQKLGYAEANPDNDIEGIDAAYKIAILANVAFRTDVRPGDVYHEGISKVAALDFRYAEELGYTIKLLAIAKKTGDCIQVRVHPAFVPEHLLLAKVEGVFNAVQIDGDLSGRIILYGRGAGAEPTASVIVADAIHLAQNKHLAISTRPDPPTDGPKKLLPIEEIETSYYIRMVVDDHPGVLAQITKVLGENHISISSVIQKRTEDTTQTAEIVIMTHPALEKAMQQSMKQIQELEAIKDICSFIRVED